MGQVHNEAGFGGSGTSDCQVSFQGGFGGGPAFLWRQAAFVVGEFVELFLDALYGCVKRLKGGLELRVLVRCDVVFPYSEALAMMEDLLDGGVTKEV